MLCPEELVLLISSVAVSLSKNIDDDELGVLAAAFTQLGDTLATILAQKDYIENKCSPSNDIE